MVIAGACFDAAEPSAVPPRKMPFECPKAAPRPRSEPPTWAWAWAWASDGCASLGFVFRHGDGTAYGSGPDVARMEAARQALGALEHLGFKPTQARALVDAALAAGAPSDTEALVRAALRVA